jgi:hypothetical protein
MFAPLEEQCRIVKNHYMHLKDENHWRAAEETSMRDLRGLLLT